MGTRSQSKRTRFGNGLCLEIPFPVESRVFVRALILCGRDTGALYVYVFEIEFQEQERFPKALR